MFRIIATLLILPVVYVWGRVIVLAFNLLGQGMPFKMFLTNYFHPSIVMVSALCVLVLSGISCRIRGFRTGGMLLAAFFILSGAGCSFSLVRTLWSGDHSMSIKPAALLWIANWAALCVMLNLRQVRDAFGKPDAALPEDTERVTRFANRVCILSYWLFVGLMFLMPAVFRATTQQEMFLMPGVSLLTTNQVWGVVLVSCFLVGTLSNGWVESKGWDVTEFPVFERVVLFAMLLMAVTAWTLLTIRYDSGGQSIRPNIYYLFMAAGLQSGILGSFFAIVKDRDNDIKALVGYCGIGLALSIVFLLVQQFNHLERMDLRAMSVREAPAKMRYGFGSWFDAGIQEFGGWGATLLVLGFFCIQMTYLFTIALASFTGWRYIRNVGKIHHKPDQI